MQTVITRTDINTIYDLLADFFSATWKKPFIIKGIQNPKVIEQILNGGYGESSYFPTVHDKAAKLLDIILTQEPYLSANPRTAIVAIEAMLNANGLKLSATETQTKELIIPTLMHGKLPKNLGAWIKEFSASTPYVRTENKDHFKSLIVKKSGLLFDVGNIEEYLLKKNPLVRG